MTRMIGQSGWFRECKDCCGVRHEKKALRRLERKQWLGDFITEVTYEEPVYPPGYDHYPEGGHAYPENLSGIERVTFIPAAGV